jgi:hypothetical protein
MADTPQYLSVPFANVPVFADGVHVGFTVGVTLAHEGQTVTEQVNALCGDAQAASLSVGPLEDFTAWSRQMVIDHDLVARANSAMAAKLAEQAS